MKRYNLKFWRMKQGLTQAQMGAKLGISAGHYKGIENGVYDPSKKVLDKLLAAYDMGAYDAEIARNIKELFKKEEYDTIEKR